MKEPENGNQDTGTPPAQKPPLMKPRSSPFKRFIRTEPGKSLFLLLAGSLLTATGFFLQQKFVAEPAEKDASKKSAIEKKLQQIYGPLALYVNGGGYTIGAVIEDKAMFSRLTENYHLLSPEIQKIFSEYMANIHGGFDAMEIRSSNMKAAIEASEKFKAQLEKEIEGLNEDLQKLK